MVSGEDLRTNGIAFSPMTRSSTSPTAPAIVAFDVTGPGKLANRRDFAKLESGGDGMAVDAEGRLYVTFNPGVQVFDKTGASLGVIPTPRGVISVAFAGADKKTLYVVGSGADDANGQPIREGPQQTAATIYTLPMSRRASRAAQITPADLKVCAYFLLVSCVRGSSAGFTYLNSTGPWPYRTIVVSRAV